MKIQTLFSLTLSLSLVACQVSAPLLSPQPQQTSGATPAIILAPKANSPMFSAQVKATGQYEAIHVDLSALTGFRTQLAQVQQLAYIQVTLTGEGISIPVRHNGAEYLPVSTNLTASLSGISNVAGKLRLLQVQGYDSAKQPLATFKASAWYRSQSGVTNLTLNVNRSQNLLVEILRDLLLNRPSVLASLDVLALETRINGIQGYRPQTGEFDKDPAIFDAAAIAALIVDGQPLPDAPSIASKTSAQYQVNVAIVTANGVALQERITLILNDPLSRPLALLKDELSGSVASINNVIPGNWSLSAYSSEGLLLANTSVNVSANGDITIPNDQLNLPAGEFAVTNVTNASQKTPVVAVDADGDFVIAWQNANQGQIKAQRFDATGKTVGNEILVNAGSNFAQDPAIAINSSGDFVISWVSDGRNVYARSFYADGTSNQAEVQVSSSVTAENTHPAVAMDDSGDFVIAWDHYDSDNTYADSILARRYNANVSPKASEFPVSNTGNTQQFNPAIAGTADGSKFAITWQEYRNISKNDIYVSYFDENQGIISATEQVNTYSSNSQERPVIAMDADGDAVISWQSRYQDGSDYGVYARRYNNTGIAIDPAEFKVNTYTSGNQTEPSVAVDSVGDFVIGWRSSEQDGSQASIYAQRYAAAGTPVGTEFKVNTFVQGSQTKPAVGMDNTGNFVFSWQTLPVSDFSLNFISSVKPEQIAAKLFTNTGVVK